MIKNYLNVHCQKLNIELHNISLKSTLSSLTSNHCAKYYTFNISHMIIPSQDTKEDNDVLI